VKPPIRVEDQDEEVRAVEIIRKDIPSDVVEIHKGEEGGCKICELGDKEVDYSSRTTRDRAE
jgi:hypothetical protein